ncbi:MAG TPA: hypothetical protein VN428_20575, partial [Bryobacteraceae bacterium]|nr:hypothetical protein [Bryobacteraceae bacterium]
GGDMYRSAVLPSTPSGVCSSTPPAAPASIAVVRPHAGGTASRVLDFLERPFRPEVPPRFQEAGESGIRMADLAPFERRSLHGFAASFLPTLPAPPIRGAGIQVPRSDLPGALAQTLPPPSVTPISAPATPMQIASSARSAESGFSAAVQLLSPGAAAWPARTLAPGGLLPYAFGPVSMRHTAEAAAAEMPLRVPQVSHLRVQSTYTGLRNAGVLPVTGRAVNHGTSRFGEQWIIPPAAAIEFSRVATNSTVGPRLTPARAVIANVRLTPVHWGDQPRPLFEAPGLAAVTMMPATTVSAGPAVGAVSLMRLPMPAVQEMSGGPRPALCAKELRGPAAVAVLKRTAPLPWPGYPVFSFTGYEALDFDDDNTCVLAGAVEPGPLAPVLPRGLTSAPQVRVIGPCEPLVCVVEAAEGSQPAIRPGTMVAFTLEPELVVMPASVSPEMEQEAYAIAAGESVQPRLASRGGLRLFR